MHTLTFVRKANQYKDATSGLIYIHSWATGWQELIFHSKQHAADFVRVMNGGADGKR